MALPAAPRWSPRCHVCNACLRDFGDPCPDCSAPAFKTEAESGVHEASPDTPRQTDYAESLARIAALDPDETILLTEEELAALLAASGRQ